MNHHEPDTTPTRDFAAAPATAAAYQLNSVTKRYRKGNTDIVPVRDLNLEITRGEFVTVQGPTGGGKSTLLQLLGALDSPTSGEILFNGTALSGMTSAELTLLRQQHIGFVFQSFNLIPTLTAAENVWVAIEHRKLPPSERDHLIAAALERVGLSERGTHFPHELSGGQQQRVAIARAIISDPTVLLADEPTGNLDEAMRDEILEVLHQLNTEGLTIVAVTHDSAVAAQAHRRLILRNGGITVK